MAHKIELRIACLYLLLFAMVLLYGTGLVRKAYNYREVDLEYTKKEIILEDNALRLALRNGYITMYYGKAKLTEDSGLACFFSVKGTDYTTVKAIWKIEKLSSVELLATLGWPGLPIKQIWHLLLKDGKLIWRIDLKINEDMIIHDLVLVFFFRNNYQEWISFYEQGRMPVLDVLQQRKAARSQVASNAIGLIAGGKNEKLFPAVGLNLREGVSLNEVSLSSCRDRFSRVTFSSVSLGGEDPLRVFKNSTVLLSSGEIVLFDKKDDLLKYLTMRQNKIEN
jgi:hypothetical protein